MTSKQNLSSIHSHRRNIELYLKPNKNNIPFKHGNIDAYSEQNERGDVIYRESKHTCEYLTYQYLKDKTISIGYSYALNNTIISINYIEYNNYINHTSTFGPNTENPFQPLKASMEKTINFDDKGRLISKYKWTDKKLFNNRYPDFKFETYEEVKYDINDNVIYYTDNDIIILSQFNINNEIISYTDNKGEFWHEHIGIEIPYKYKKVYDNEIFNVHGNVSSNY